MPNSSGSINKQLPKRPVIQKNDNSLSTNENINDILQAKNKENDKNVAGLFNAHQKDVEYTTSDPVSNNVTVQESKSAGQGEDSNLKQTKNKTKKKVLILLLVILAFCAIGGVCWFLLKNNFKKLETPTFEIVQLINNDTIINVEKVDGAKEYKYFIFDGNKNEIFSQSFTDNHLALKTILSDAGLYYVKVQAIGQKQEQNSDISDEKPVINRVRVSSVNVFVNGLDEIYNGNSFVGYKNNSDLSDDNLTWAADDNVQLYRVCYGADSASEQLLTIDVIAAGTTVVFPLSSIYQFGGGIYNLSVIAIAQNGSYYLNNNLMFNGNENVTLKYYEIMNAPTNLMYNSTTKVISFSFDRPTQFLGEFEVTLTYTNKTETFNVLASDVYNSTQNKYQINLTGVADDGFGRISIKAKGYGEYLIDSYLTIINV